MLYLFLSEKDIPSHYLDEQRYAKQASSSGGTVSISIFYHFPDVITTRKVFNIRMLNADNLRKEFSD